jgi:outer membrane protein TolC
MLNALSEIEGGLYADRMLAERQSLLQAQLADQQKIVELQRVQLRVGKGTQYQLQQEELNLTSTHMVILRLQNERLIQRVNLHLALGGIYKT